MKKLSIALLSLLAATVFAQNNKVQFTKKLVYELNLKEVPRDQFSESRLGITNYTNGKESIAEIGVNDNYKTIWFFDQHGTSSVSYGLGNKLQPEHAGSMREIYGEETAHGQKISVVPLDVKERVLGYTCDQFLLKPIFVSADESKNGDANFIVCLSQDLKIDNTKLYETILQLPNQVQYVTPFSGTLLKFGPEKDYKNDHIVLTEISDTNESIHFDNKQNLIDEKRYVEKMQKELKAHMESANAVEMDSTAANAAASIAMDSFLDEVEDLPQYESTFKTPSEGTFAISNFNKESKVWKILPKHCQNFEKELPKFDNKKLQATLRNYMGQVCDLYMTQISYNTVDKKVTVDELRREILEILNQWENLSNGDRNKLLKYLNKLD